MRSPRRLARRGTRFALSGIDSELKNGEERRPAVFESRWVRLEADGAGVRPENGRDLAAHDEVWALLDALDLQLFERTVVPGGGSATEARAASRRSECGKARRRDLEWL
jgi:hypothetical protein